MSAAATRRFSDGSSGTDYFKSHEDLFPHDGFEKFLIGPISVISTAGDVNPRACWVRSTNAVFEVISLDSTEEKYNALFEALNLMRSMDEDESMFIDADTHRNACSVLSLLSYRKVAPPKVYSHGGDAVVFTWVIAGQSYQLTVSNGTATLGKRVKGQGAILLGHVHLATHGIVDIIPFLQVRSDRTGTNPTRR
ncbi:hypothetical protein [Rhizobium herbae]|uniref:Uncharacterized protein n=1 Tax=Rhizobium herbae TaxID=508661 RepID=A0ABS4EPB5_9HYPH|nr:hypothetical protein [Rhizobium herbae]MBP1859780.1 hypothetical protein [Rhizobium herbae]